MHQISLKLDTIEAIRTDETVEEPYLWTIFFAIDGRGFSIVLDSLEFAFLNGAIRPQFGLGSQGNLGPNMSVGHRIAISPLVGSFATDVSPIVGLGQTIAPTVVCIAILMEEDNVTTFGAEAGHQALNAFLVDSVNAFFADLNLLDVQVEANERDVPVNVVVQERFEALKDELQPQIARVVTDAIVERQSWIENVAAWIDPDDAIGEPGVQVFTLDQLSNDDTSFTMVFDNERSRYLVNGHARARELVDINPVLSGSIEIDCSRRINTPQYGDVIRAVGGTTTSGPWIMSRAFATQMAMSGLVSFYVGSGANRVDVHVVRRDDGEPFLRTDPDQTTDNNLLSLPDCPVFLDEIED